MRPGRPGVSILTAHRAKGRQWSAVVVASVCEGIWPVVDSAAELIDLTELSPDGQCAPPGPSEQMASERRLFYVACTRARHRLLVTTVDQNRAVGLRPSRLIDRLGCPIEPEDRTEPSWLGLNQLVGGLRRVTTDPVAHPSLRQAAAARLADLASRPDPVSGRRLVRQADPERWWPVGGDGGGDLESTWRLGPGQAGAADAGAGPEPIDGPWRLTGSHLRSLLSCPRQWFLARRAKAEGPPGPAAAVGALVHRLVQDLGSGSIDRSQADRRLDREWPEILFPAQWQAAAERRAAGETLDRFERWLSQRTGWRLLGVEVPFELSLTIGQGRFQLVGRIDRIDQDASGRIRLTDFKTARRPLSAAQAESDDQLGVYQLAVRSGGLADLTGTAPRLAAAELVYLRCPAGPQGAQPTLRRQPSLDLTPHLQRDPPSLGLTEAGLAQVGPAQVWPTWVHRRLALAGQMMTEGRFPALAQAGCAWCQFAASCPAGRPDQEDA
ncbi:MAG: PD-(D/E)XK nuclease family protein [Propionibacteriaceae bacterium]|nr:PD-(D/E)XK nuclease family protein [Propionibacteriaceae bacterium]